MQDLQDAENVAGIKKLFGFHNRKCEIEIENRYFIHRLRYYLFILQEICAGFSCTCRNFRLDLPPSAGQNILQNAAGNFQDFFFFSGNLQDIESKISACTRKYCTNFLQNK